jgi:hypothetical protein
MASLGLSVQALARLCYALACLVKGFAVRLFLDDRANLPESSQA